VIGEIAGLGGVDQGDVTGAQRHPVVALRHAGAAVKLEHRKVLAAFARCDFLWRAVQPRLASIDKAEFECTALVFTDVTGKLIAQGLRTEGAADAVDLMDPLIEAVTALCN